jgi:hypothetical protein
MFLSSPVLGYDLSVYHPLPPKKKILSYGLPPSTRGLNYNLPLSIFFYEISSVGIYHFLFLSSIYRFIPRSDRHNFTDFLF